MAAQGDPVKGSSLFPYMTSKMQPEIVMVEIAILAKFHKLQFTQGLFSLKLHSILKPGTKQMRQQLKSRRSETVDYIQGMLGQLRTMADAEHCDMLAYLIEMAYIEASDVVRNAGPLNLGEDQRDRTAAMPFQTTGKIKLQ